MFARKKDIVKVSRPKYILKDNKGNMLMFSPEGYHVIAQVEMHPGGALGFAITVIILLKVFKNTPERGFGM
jgi:hypothetical protein